MTMKSCNKKIRARYRETYTKKIGKTEKTKYKLIQQTLLTNLR